MASLSDILHPAEDAAPSSAPPHSDPPPATADPDSVKVDDMAQDDAFSTPKGDHAKAPDNADGDDPNHTSTTASTRRNANGATASVYSGNKMRHLKKEDGIPLWRKDIQFDFLDLVFHDQTKCFTKYSDGSREHTFADIYIDAMAKSSKCSKILKEKLLQDQEGAISMAMVCLLVNVGRMNTTLNFFPEMRAQLRTYHSIPALQARQDPNAYKQLQDAPRLKSILKGATEDEPQPSTIEDIKAASIPRTNPVNLIFVMSQYAPKISEVHFPPPRDFFDLVMRSSLSSATRAKAFLWLIWWYLESDFSAADSQRNPFGPGQLLEGEEGTDMLPLKVPTLESLTEEQADNENVDTEEEKHFGEVKRKERIAILASEPSPAMTALKRARKEKGLTTGHGVHASDDEGSEAGYYRTISTSVGKSGLAHETGSEYTRSPSPAAGRGFHAVNAKPVGDMRINNLLNSDDVGMDQSPPHQLSTAPPPLKKGPGRGNWRRHKKTENQTPAGGLPRSSQEHVPLLPNTGQLSFVSDGPPIMTQSGLSSGNKLAAATGMSPGSNLSFQTPATRDHVPTPSYQAQKRHRGVTQHQSAVINHRKLQIDYTLDRQIRKARTRARDKRQVESCILRAWKRIRYMPTDYDSEEEAIRVRKAKDRIDKNDKNDKSDKNDDDWRGLPRGKDYDDMLDGVDQWRRPQLLYAGFTRVNGEPSDVGEEAKSLAQAFRRCSRRIERWQEVNLPGASMLRRQSLAEQGLLTPRRRKSVQKVESDAMDIVEDHRRAAPRAKTHRKRNVKGKAGLKREPEPEADEDEGGAELDAEDRELLGEVDADADESEDESDEDMDD